VTVGGITLVAVAGGVADGTGVLLGTGLLDWLGGDVAGARGGGEVTVGSDPATNRVAVAVGLGIEVGGVVGVELGVGDGMLLDVGVKLRTGVIIAEAMNPGLS
jgi:hypothetical protein